MVAWIRDPFCPKMLSSSLRSLAVFAMIAATQAFTPALTVPSRSSLLQVKTGRTNIMAQNRMRRSPTGVSAGLKMQKQDGDGTDALDRFVACLPYALPLADSFEWGHYIFDAFPLAAIPFLPLFPVISLLNLPFVSFGIFIILFNFVARNPQFSRLVRFNTLQVSVPASESPFLSLRYQISTMPPALFSCKPHQK